MMPQRKWVALLNPCLRPNDVLMVVEQHRGITVAPLRPTGHRRKHLVHRLHEVVAFHFVERVAEINLQEA